MPTPRRDLLTLGAISLAGAVAQTQAVAAQEKDPDQKAAAAKDRDFVLAAGLSEKEADCWELIAKAAGAFFELPELHPMDKSEVASAIHIVQNKLLSRPTYRKYLETAKASRK